MNNSGVEVEARSCPQEQEQREQEEEGNKNADDCADDKIMTEEKKEEEEEEEEEDTAAEPEDAASPGGDVENEEEEEEEEDHVGDFLLSMVKKMSMKDEKPIPTTPVLKSFNLAGVVDYIQKEKPQNVIIMAGAGKCLFPGGETGCCCI